jgi:hypothetical protein
MSRGWSVHMIELHPKYLIENGKREFVVLPYDEFVALRELLEDAADLLDLREAMANEADSETLTLSEVKPVLGLGQETEDRHLSD